MVKEPKRIKTRERLQQNTENFKEKQILPLSIEGKW